MTERSKDKITVLQRISAWFDASRYEPASRFGAVEWARSLAFRRILGGLDIRCANSTGPDDPFTKALFSMLLSPLPKAPRESAETALLLVAGGGNWRAVSDIEMREIFDIVDLIDRAAPEQREIRNKQIELLDREPIPPRSEWFEEPYRSLPDFLQEKGWAPSLGFCMVGVDLSATDDVILSDFTAWLATKRAKFGSNLSPPYRFTQADFSQWHKAMVLAYLDIRLWCHFVGVSITQKQLGDLLFPLEADVDTTERVRKVVKPLAEKLLREDYLTALESQAATELRSDRKKTDDAIIPEQN